VSSEHFTEIISKTLGVDFIEAKKLKIKYGLEEKIKLKIKSEGSNIKKERGKIFEALIPVLVDLIQQIKKHLYYYQTHATHEHLPPGENRVSKILLCGGGANLKGLPEFLSSELKLPVELGNPWINILSKGQKNISKFPQKETLRYATALGLALRGIKGE